MTTTPVTYSLREKLTQGKHAIGDLYRRQNSDIEGNYPWEELFFEDEALAEYGYSVIMAVSSNHNSIQTTTSNL